MSSFKSRMNRSDRLFFVYQLIRRRSGDYLVRPLISSTAGMVGRGSKESRIFVFESVVCLEKRTDVQTESPVTTAKFS